jgi:predicted ATP-binding protein involved in virulence
MIIHQLNLEQFRGLKKAEIQFQPGFNLLVGENGSGKSSVLWAIRVLLSHILRALSNSKEPAINFTENDVARDAATEWPFLTATLEFSLDSLEQFTPLKYSGKKNRSTFREGIAGDPRYQAIETQDRYAFDGSLGNNPKSPKLEQLLAIFYSPHRSLTSEKTISKRKVPGGQLTAYFDALQERELRLGELAERWNNEADLKRSDGSPDRANRAIQQALPVFLDSFSNIRVEGDDKPQLFIDKHGVKLDLTQVSDGERSLLGILMDLTRRLSQANPSLENPAQEAEAVVLIDEIDLHLHPRWQRRIIERLTQTFKKCQFIATTHSPQIIGELPPEQIIILENGQEPYNPDQSFGMDSNWILRHLMDASERDLQIKHELKVIEAMIQDRRFLEASEAINALSKLGQFPELVRLQTRIDRIRRLGK